MDDDSYQEERHDDFECAREALYVEEAQEVDALIRGVAQSNGDTVLKSYPRIKQIVSGRYQMVLSSW